MESIGWGRGASSSSVRVQFEFRLSSIWEGEEGGEFEVSSSSVQVQFKLMQYALEFSSGGRSVRVQFQIQFEFITFFGGEFGFSSWSIFLREAV